MKLFNWFKRTSKFSIEYYPITKRYYPKYDGCFLYTRPFTGIVTINNNITFADYSNTEAGAREIINKFKEQQLKENVITIPI